MVRDLDDGFQEVLKNLKNRGFTKQVSHPPLIGEIKRAFNILTDKSTQKYVKTMSQLGYITDKGSYFDLHFPEEEEEGGPGDQEVSEDLQHDEVAEVADVEEIDIRTEAAMK